MHPNQLAAPRVRFDPRRMPIASSVGVWTLAAMDDFQRIVAAAYLFRPEFVKLDDCILLAEMYDPSRFLEWMRLLGDDRSRVEHVINNVYLGDLFLNLSADAERELSEASWSEDAVLELAEVLASCWRDALAESFPGREFHVAVDERHDDLPAVSFYTKRERSSRPGDSNVEDLR